MIGGSIKVPTDTEPKRFSRVITRMSEPNEQIHVTGEEARAGATPHMTRYILGISLALVIAIFAFLLFIKS